MSRDFVPRDSGHELRLDIPRNLSGPISIRNSEVTRGKPILERLEYWVTNLDRNPSGRIQATLSSQSPITCLLPNLD